MSARLLQVIEVEVVRGDGTNEPYRKVIEYWSTDGTLLAERDDWMLRSSEQDAFNAAVKQAEEEFEKLSAQYKKDTGQDLLPTTRATYMLNAISQAGDEIRRARRYDSHPASSFQATSGTKVQREQP